VPTAHEALTVLNAQRAAIGAPPVSVRMGWSSACLAHVHYLLQNMPTATVDPEAEHSETPGAPGYSPRGAWAAANSVIATGADGWGQSTSLASATPWESAPLHLAQLLAPQLRQIGVATVAGENGDVFSCVTTWPGYTGPAPAADSVLTYPADGGSIYASERASEAPFTPGEKVGLPDGAVTGPYLYAFAWGSLTNSRTRVAAASLAGPHGPVDVRVVDFAVADGYLPPGSALLVPAAPLHPGASYTASITFALGGKRLSHTWSFRAGGGGASGSAGMLAVQRRPA
jgi:cysteine-rich secretory family protein